MVDNHHYDADLYDDEEEQDDDDADDDAYITFSRDKMITLLDICLRVTKELADEVIVFLLGSR